MIQISKVSLRFGERVLLKNISWSVPDGSRFGLVGSNGAGKTTILRMIAGEYPIDSGAISVTKGDRIGYLPQDLVEIPDEPVLKFLRMRAGLDDIEIMLESCAKDLEAARPGSQEGTRLLARHESLMRQYELRDGFAFDAMACKVLKGLGFSDDATGFTCGQFSGGWKMRLLLASLLLCSPDILLLDEPTNHLDTESMEWLESWLTAFSGTVVAVSHDRRFLDSICTSIAELSLGELSLYRGGFSDYVAEKERRLEELRRSQRLQKEEIARMEEFVERFRYKASKAASVQSRIKRLEKMELVEIEEETKRVRFHFPPCARSGLDVLVLEGVGKSYGEKTVFSDVNLSIQRGDKIALVGVNGAGKSTLSRIIGGVEEPTSGIVRRGHNVKTAFFSQESSQNLDYTRSVWESTSSINPDWSERDRRSLLGAFLFGGDSIEKQVSVLSGGEKSRLALLRLLLADANLLVLDEPTNHLDMKTKDLFQRALLEFDGTLVIVSHDRFFLDNLVSRVVEIVDGGAILYPGNYSWFIEKRRERSSESAPQGSARDAAGTPQASDGCRSRRRAEAERRNELYRRKKVVLDIMNPLEARIELLEREQSARDALLGDPAFLADSSKVSALLIERDRAARLITELLEEWEDLADEVARIEETG
ncbi:MAG: ABC-F family ATP-binding cassette domain-containing protein [Synergistota bacterium]|nr:ABC-F family ATP-binding cassette domain-containing protein [Synergistota bacterium]